MLKLSGQSLDFLYSGNTFRIGKNFRNAQKPSRQSRAFPRKLLLLRAKTLQTGKNFPVGNADTPLRFWASRPKDALIMLLSNNCLVMSASYTPKDRKGIVNDLVLELQMHQLESEASTLSTTEHD